MKKYIFNFISYNKYTGEDYPYLNASTVKGKEEFFNPERNPNSNYSKKYYERTVEFDYMIPKYLSERKEYLEPDIICDMHGWVVEYPTGGKFLPISTRLKELLTQYNIAASRFYPGKVLFKGEFHPYFVWLTLSNVFESFINFDKTTFCEWKLVFSKKIGDQHEKVSSIDELKRRFVDDRTWKYWGFNRAVMKPEFKENDCCWFPILGYVISVRLKNAIEEAGMTGVEIKECPVAFEYAD